MTKPQPPKVLLWDIEASNLVADYGWVLCIAYKWFGEKAPPQIIRLRSTKEFQRDRTNDAGVLRRFIPIISQADLHVFWFGEYFDLPFVQTRILIADLKDPIPNIPFVDGWKIARNKLKLRSNRLEAVAKIIPLPESVVRQEKQHPTPANWRKANAGHVEDLRVIENRCVSDVLLLEQVYGAIRHLGSSLPNLSKVGGRKEIGCAACGSDRVQARGRRLTANGCHWRFQCQECAHWFSRPARPISS